MPSTSTYPFTIPVSYTPENNNTWINKRLYLLKDCEPITLNTKDDLWNAQRCPNDGCYCQPYIAGDKIFLQYNSQQFGGGSPIIIPELLDEKTDLPISDTGVITTEAGYYEDVLYTNLILDTTTLNACFYVRLNIFNCTLSPDDEAIIEACIATKIAEGKTPTQAAIECYTETCSVSNLSYYITEPYCPVSASCYKSIKVEGYYPKYDCYGRYYGEFVGGITNSFKPITRLPGTIEWYDHSIEETLVNRERTKARGIDKYRLRTRKIPPYVARQLANIFDSQKIFVDDVQYKGVTKMSKDFDEGGSWIVTTDLFIECGENNFACK